MPAGTFYLGLGRRYACASQLAFHLGAPFDVHGNNLVGLEGLQYEYWAEPGALAGRDAVVVLQGGDRTARSIALLRERFREVEEAGTLEVPLGRASLLPPPPLVFHLFRAKDYRPQIPSIQVQ